MTWRIDDPAGNESRKEVIVYGLKSSAGGDIRYIGQTTQSLAKRLDSHIHCPKPAKRRHLYNWIRSVLTAGFKVEIIILYENAIWGETERDLIRVFREMGYDLVNATDGGDGVLGRVWTQEQRKAASDRRKGMKFTEQHKENIRRTRLGKKQSADSIEKQRASLMGRMPKNLLQLHAAVLGKPKSLEHRRKLSEAQKRRYL